MKLQDNVLLTSQIIFESIYNDFSTEYSTSTIISTIVFLSSKITESYLKSSSIFNTLGSPVDLKLELKILEKIKFNFEFLNFYEFINEICLEFGFLRNDKIEKIEKIINNGNLNKVGFINEGYNPSEVCIAVFEDKEIELFENVYGFEIDWRNIEKIRREFGINE